MSQYEISINGTSNQMMMENSQLNIIEETI